MATVRLALDRCRPRPPKAVAAGPVKAEQVAEAHPRALTKHPAYARASTGSGLENAREITRENGEQRGVSEGENADFAGVALARPSPGAAPTLGERAKKIPTDKGWDFRYWWRSRHAA